MRNCTSVKDVSEALANKGWCFLVDSGGDTGNSFSSGREKERESRITLSFCSIVESCFEDGKSRAAFLLHLQRLYHFLPSQGCIEKHFISVSE